MLDDTIHEKSLEELPPKDSILKRKRNMEVQSEPTCHSCNVCTNEVESNQLMSHVWYHLCVEQFGCSQCQYTTDYGEKEMMEKHIKESCVGANLIDRQNQYKESTELLFKTCFPEVTESDNQSNMVELEKFQHEESSGSELSPDTKKNKSIKNTTIKGSRKQSTPRTVKVCCEICKKLVLPDSVTAHSWCHMETMPFSCSECGLSFALPQQTVLRRRHIPRKCRGAHVVDHRAENRAEYQAIRGQCFPSVPQRGLQRESTNRKVKRNVNKRSRRNVSASNKRHCCGICEKDVPHDSITVHSWSHMETQPFSCSECDQCFSWSLQTVLRKIHIPTKCPGAHVVDHRSENRSKYQQIRARCFPAVPQRRLPDDFTLQDIGTQGKNIKNIGTEKITKNIGKEKITKNITNKKERINMSTPKEYRLCCEMCKKNVSRESIRAHSWYHMDMMPFSCSKCGLSSTWARQTDLRKKHIRTKCPGAHVVDHRTENHDKYIQIRGQCFPTVPQRPRRKENE